ncbi:MAG: glycosyltransferase family 39 protein, partial [Deltaproteobacteria bacterium]|nr:glycosyltransferase family 39 protein [Deltaproteobacteria bacterium]
MSGVYDIKPLLEPGKNVIAIYLPGGFFSGFPEVRIRGAYAMSNAPIEEFVSDSSWKVSGTPDGIVGSYVWSSPLLDDRFWHSAREIRTTGRFSTVQPVSLDPRLLERLPSGSWIMAHGGETHHVSFSRGFDLGSDSGGWLELAATGAYDVSINGWLVAMRPEVVRAALFGPEAPVPLTGQSVLTSAQLPLVVSPTSVLPGSGMLSAIPRGTGHFALGNLANDIGIETRGLGTAARGGVQFAPQTVVIPQGPAVATGIVMPELSRIAPPSEPVVPQLQPLPWWLGSNPANIILIAYDISRWLRRGHNLLVVRVDAGRGPAAMFADVLVRTANGKISGFGTDGSWSSGRDSSRVDQGNQVDSIAGYGAAPWGRVPEVAAYPHWLPGDDVRTTSRWILTITTVVISVVLLWFVAAALFCPTGMGIDALWGYDAIWHLPMLVALLILLLTCYDIRFPYDWCFRPNVVVPFLVLLPASKLALLVSKPSRESLAQSVKPAHTWKKPLCILLLACIVAVGFFVRARHLLAAPMGPDEVMMGFFSQGVLKKGFPFVVNSSYTRWLATYELVPYPIALSSLIVGWTPMAIRLPALVFGSFTVGLVGWVGYRMMGWRVGIVSALIYAFLPVTINWARDGFYPSQESFFALGTFWLFYEAIHNRGLDYHYLRLSVLAFILSYLSWEASGFIIVALFVSILVTKWGEFEWLTDRKLWACFMTVSAIVIIQLCYRQLVMIPDYLGVVFDLSQVASPSPVFLNPLVFQPFYYIKLLFFAENHYVLSILVLTGLFLVRRQPHLLYLYISLGALLVCYSCFLNAYAPRYCFNWLSLLVLSAVGTFFYFYDLILALPVNGAAVIVRAMALASATGLLVVSANPYAMKLYRLAAEPYQPPFYTRLGVAYKQDSRSCDMYVHSRLLPGDGVVIDHPQMYAFDTGKGPSFGIDSMYSLRIIYDGGRSTPEYIDPWYGVSTIRSLSDLQDALTRYKRLWIIQNPLSVAYYNVPKISSYIRSNGRVV